MLINLRNDLANFDLGLSIFRLRYY